MINANQKMKMTTIPMLMNCILIISQMGETTGGHALHASSYQIQHLWESEQQVIRHIQDVLLSMEDIKQVLNMYVSSWESIVEGQKDIAGIPDDPVATFALLRHVAEGWREVDSTLTKVKDMYKNIEYLASRPDSEALPNNDDVLQATEALVKLAHIYRFNATALERGLFIQEALNKDITDSLDTSTSSAAYLLSQNDLVSIGLTAVNKGYFNIGVEFLRAAKSMSSARNMSSIQKNKQFRSASHFSLERIESLLNTAIKVHNHVLNTQGPRSLTHTASVTPYGTSDNNRQLPLDDNQVIIGGEYLNLHDNKTWMLNQRALVEQQQVERLCRGDNLRPISVRSTLSCRNYNGRDPWLLLGPFRIEELSHDPHITVIYDVITPEESQSIISTARAYLESPHNTYVNKSEDATLSRWSLKHVWLDNQSARALQSLSRRLAHVTRVHVDDNTSEPFMNLGFFTDSSDFSNMMRYVTNLEEGIQARME
ncbi:hypothetical protein SK128_012590 [Halocaridina rubra]|uniref:Prolyl 4-hydroxylase N-terminal domain-containing protein n=1 Tax=Halocaridina rubra TaxID=373956 RepID=A0AAN9FW98_HALRR